jgi:hypothetical protein
MSLQRAAIGAFGLLALTTAFAQEVAKPAPSADTFICRQIPRPESRIKERVCGSPQQVARQERDRNILNALSRESARSSNGNGQGTITFE